MIKQTVVNSALLNYDYQSTSAERLRLVLLAFIIFTLTAPIMSSMERVYLHLCIVNSCGHSLVPLYTCIPVSMCIITNDSQPCLCATNIPLSVCQEVYIFQPVHRIFLYKYFLLLGNQTVELCLIQNKQFLSPTACEISLGHLLTLDTGGNGKH